MAVATGDLSVVQTLFNYNIPLAIHWGRSDSPFKMAIKCGHLFLIEKETSQDVINEGLFIATKTGNVESVRALLQAGASLKNQKSLLGLTPLHVACNNGHYEVVKLFLDNGAFVDERDSDGMTPLHWSTLNMRGHIADLLLEHGADVLAKTNDGSSVIECISMSFGKFDAQHLIKQGAPYPQTTFHQEMLEDMGSSFGSAFYKKYCKAIIKEDTQGALAVLEQASNNDFNTATMTMDGLTALHLAVIRGNGTIVNALIKRPNTRLRRLTSKIPIVSSYVQHPVNINCRDEKGRTPLIWAARLGYTQIYQDLRKAGAKCGIKDKTGRLAPNYAADYRNIDTLREMVVDGTISAK